MDIITIGMHHHRILGLPTPDGHQERVYRELAIDARTHRPTDHLARKQVEHHGQIQPTLMRADIRDVRRPDTVGLLYVKLTLQVIWRHQCRRAAPFVLAPGVAGLRTDSGQSHQPMNAIDATLFAELS